VRRGRSRPSTTRTSAPCTTSEDPSAGSGHAGIDFLVLEYLEGETLADRLAGGGPKSPPPRLRRSAEAFREGGKTALQPHESLKIAIDICDALDKAHRSGIVHRDLKPANVFLVRGGASAPPVAKLLDFGLAKRAAPTVVGHGFSRAGTAEAVPYATAITAQGTILGTFQYMAPEQIEGLEADARTDIFALGALMFEMLAGRPAFEGKTRASLLGAI
jgi:serine/threonine protein kinase